MTGSSNRFDMLLGQVRSNQLKSMLRLWGGRGITRKDDILDFILRALADPKLVRAAVESLDPLGRTALALVNWLGGAIEAGALTVGLRATGIPIPKPRGWRDASDHWLVRELIQRGLLLSGYTPDPTYLSSYGSSMLFSDARLLAHAGPLQPVALPIQPASTPITSSYRRPATVALDIIGILQAIDTIGGLKRTKAGAIRTGDLRKLARALKWTAEDIAVDGLQFPNPTLALAEALAYADLLTVQDDLLDARGAAERFARRSYAEQAGELLHGFLRARAWREGQLDSWHDSTGEHHAQARLALSIGLAALPATPEAFFAIDDVDQALFDRIGEYFTLSYPPHPPYTYGKKPEETRREEQTWRAKLRADWLKRERLWLGQALTTWLYYLGIVELGFADDTPASVRLTELGRAVLHPGQPTALDTPAPAAGAAWMVQPDFEVLVYLDRAGPEQIMFVEQHAERLEAQQHVARYRLTRESVYQGLERGGTPDELLDGLRAAAGAEVPQNVLATIREWAAQRERITLRRRASLLEYPTTQARRQALDAGLKGQPVGERFVLFNDKLPAVQVSIYVDYSEALIACLSADEQGAITMRQPAPDLLLRPQLDRWAERTSDTSWQLSAASVAAAIKAGATIRDLLRLLQDRLTHPLPPLLGVALRAWAGEQAAVALAHVVVLRCPQPEVFAAIAGSALLRPYLRGTLAPDVLLVDERHVAALRERLAWAGLTIT
jgi:hypothetical protein